MPFLGIPMPWEVAQDATEAMFQALLIALVSLVVGLVVIVLGFILIWKRPLGLIPSSVLGVVMMVIGALVALGVFT